MTTVPEFVGPPAPVKNPPIKKRRDTGTGQAGKVEFDKYVANYYVNKIVSSKARGIAFNLTLTQVKNMLRAKKCQYTGIDLTHVAKGTGIQSPTDVTIERIDPSRPYETGNVCAISFAANQAKSMFDAQFGKNSVAMLVKMAKEISKRTK